MNKHSTEKLHLCVCLFDCGPCDEIVSMLPQSELSPALRSVAKKIMRWKANHKRPDNQVSSCNKCSKKEIIPILLFFCGSACFFIKKDLTLPCILTLHDISTWQWNSTYQWKPSRVSSSFCRFSYWRAYLSWHRRKAAIFFIPCCFWKMIQLQKDICVTIWGIPVAPMVWQVK